MGKQWKQWQTLLFWAPKITAYGHCSNEIKRRLLLGRKVMTNLDSILKSRDITLPTKVHLVKAMVFPVVMYGCESWTIKKAKGQRIDAFWLLCWRSLLRMVGWHHQFDGHEFEQALGVGDRQRSLVCYSPGVTKSQTRPSNWTELNLHLLSTY